VREGLSVLDSLRVSRASFATASRLWQVEKCSHTAVVLLSAA
jgi:hypothetical protein